MGRDTRQSAPRARGASTRSTRARVPPRQPTQNEIQRIQVERALKAAVKREKTIQRSARLLERLTGKTDHVILELAQHLIGADFRIVPASSPAAAVNE